MTPNGFRAWRRPIRNQNRLPAPGSAIEVTIKWAKAKTKNGLRSEQRFAFAYESGWPPQRVLCVVHYCRLYAKWPLVPVAKHPPSSRLHNTLENFRYRLNHFPMVIIKICIYCHPLRTRLTRAAFIKYFLPLQKSIINAVIIVGQISPSSMTDEILFKVSYATVPFVCRSLPLHDKIGSGSSLPDE